FDLILCEKGFLSCGWLFEVRVVHDDRPGAGPARLVDQRVHPCSAGLALAGVEAGLEQTDCFAGLVEDLPGLDGVDVAGDVRPRGEGDAEELLSRVEDALLHNVAESKIRLEGCIIDRDLTAELLLIEGPVACLETIA